MKGILTKISKPYHSALIYLTLRNETEKRTFKVIDFRPHFYVPDVNGTFQGYDGKKLKIIYTKTPDEVPEEREKYPEHFQADVPYTRLFLIETEVKSGVEVPDKDEISWLSVKPTDYKLTPRLCFIDIEVYSKGIFPEAQKAEYPVVSVTIYDSYEKKFFIFVKGEEPNRMEDNRYITFHKTEVDLLIALSRYFLKAEPDVLIGWNILFDTEYLLNRNRKLKLPTEIWKIEFFDLLSADRKLFKRPSYRLQNVTLSEGYLKEMLTLEEVWKAREKGNLEPLIRKNFEDVYAMVEHDKRHKIFDFFHNLKIVTGVAHYEDTFYSSVLIDTLLLRLARKRGIILPSIKRVERREPYEGALVMQPVKGVFGNTAVFDMSRYYPNILLSFFPESLLSQLVLDLMVERDRLDLELDKLEPGTKEYEIVKSRRDSMKFLINAIYGFSAYPRSRIYDREVGEKVAEKGREGLMKAKELAESLGYKIIYYDTDSLHLQIPQEKAYDVCKRISAEVSEYFKKKYSLKESLISMKFEKYFKKVVFLEAKKRYAAHCVFDSKPCDYVLIRGFEAIRTDQSEYTREIQNKLLSFIVKGADNNQIKDYIKGILENFRNQKLGDIAFAKGIDREFGEYKVKPAHVRGALLSNLYLKTNFGKGSRPKVLYVKRVKGLPLTDVVCFEDESSLPEVDIDWSRMEDVTIRKKVEDILGAVGISWDEILGVRQPSLKEFLK